MYVCQILTADAKQTYIIQFPKENSKLTKEKKSH